MLTFNVPSGIGDLSWIYSKLINSKKTFRLVICGDQPRRTLPFAQLLPGVIDARYGEFSYWPTFMRQKRGIPVDTDIDKLADGAEYYLSANLHVDNGGKLADFLPHQKTTYHYDINTTPEHKEMAELWLGQVKAFDTPFVGIYTSKHNSYKGDWKFWSYEDWARFIQSIYELTNATFVFIGAEFDLDLGKKVVKECVRRSIPHINLIGQTHIGEAWELLKRLDYMFAYASGIGIICDVVDTPAMHFLPTPRHDLLCDTYADPVNIESGRHINKLFCSVEDAVKDFKERGLHWITDSVSSHTSRPSTKKKTRRSGKR